MKAALNMLYPYRKLSLFNLNDTFLVIGKVISIQIEGDIISPDGFLHLDKVNSICSNGIDGYYTTELIERYQYAKPGIQPQKIN